MSSCAMDAAILARIQHSRTACSRSACLRSHVLAPPSQGRCPTWHCCSSPQPSARRFTACRSQPEEAGDRKQNDVEVPGSFSRDDNHSVMIKYVNEVEPAIVEAFESSGPPEVVEAMKATVSNLLGTLPQQFFEVNVTTLGDNLRSLMYSFMMTGYLYRHVVDHLELQRGLDRSLPGSLLQDDLQQDLRPGSKFGVRSLNPDGYAQGVNKIGVSGEVQRWHYQTGVDTVSAEDYIEMLESEIDVLREQLQSDARDEGGENEVLAFLRRAPEANVHQLQAGPEVARAMEAFLCRLLGTDDMRELQRVTSDTSSTELSRLLSWVMIVGYTLRSMEIRFSMEQSFLLPYVALEDSDMRDSL